MKWQEAVIVWRHVIRRLLLIVAWSRDVIFMWMKNCRFQFPRLIMFFWRMRILITLECCRIFIKMVFVEVFLQQRQRRSYVESCWRIALIFRSLKQSGKTEKIREVMQSRWFLSIPLRMQKMCWHILFHVNMKKRLILHQAFKSGWEMLAICLAQRLLKYGWQKQDIQRKLCSPVILEIRISHWLKIHYMWTMPIMLLWNQRMEIEVMIRAFLF